MIRDNSNKRNNSIGKYNRNSEKRGIKIRQKLYDDGVRKEYGRYYKIKQYNNFYSVKIAEEKMDATEVLVKSVNL